MKKLIFLLISLLILIFTLCACECEHEWKDATCTSPKACTKCGATEGDTIEHTYTVGICTEKQHCTECGKEKSGFEHTWSNATCGENQICTVCNETGKLIEHIWSAQSCEAPRTCTICKQTDGEALGHNPNDVPCDQAQICTRCNIVLRKPTKHEWNEATCTSAQKCKNCKETQGSALGHDWKLQSQIEPTCNYGYLNYACGNCDLTKTTKKAPVEQYHMCDAQGYCQRCETQFDRDKMTLESIVMDGGTVLHAGIFTTTEIKNKIYKTILADDIDMPIVDLTGDLSKMSSNYRTTIGFTYEDETRKFECNAETRIQGASSASKPKKNYSIKLVDDAGANKKVVLDSSWGKEHKYCMKANYIDYSQARNVVSCKIYGDIISARNVKDELSSLPNGGAIDGFPIIVYNNGQYHGLYTMNIPKDKWMFNMDDSNLKNQAILMCENWNNSVAFRSLISTTNMASSGWELEFASNEESTIDNDTSWVVQSMNELIDFVMKNDGEAFKNGISQYADIDKCIDSMIYTFVTCADDNTSKNILWVTYDGKVWFSSIYDMDGTWGMRWNGNIEFDENTHPISALADGKGLAPERNPSNYNLLWERIYINFFDKVVERYQELRKTALSYENIEKNFVEFFAMIPDAVRKVEKLKWTGVPTQNIDHLEQILDFARKRLEVMDLILKTN